MLRCIAARLLCIIFHGAGFAPGWLGRTVMRQLDDTVLMTLERRYADGISSADLLEVCADHGIHLSEASLRKYVQLGLLPRSVRVGRKGKHKGSQGMYPVRALRQLLRVKEMMAESYTIEEIKRDFLFVRSDVEQLEQTLGVIFKTLAKVLKRKREEGTTHALSREIEGAERLGRDLVSSLVAIETKLTRRLKLQGASASAS